jgi:hypothetical protein
MEKGKHGTGSANGNAIDRYNAAQNNWSGIADMACKLSHIVQSGRRVSKQEMTEIAQEVRGPSGFLRME